MQVLKFSAKPTFVSTVDIPTTDGAVKIKVTFKYMDGEAWKAFVDEHFSAESKEKLVDVLPALIETWDAKNVEREYSHEALTDLGNVHAGAPMALLNAYIAARNEGKLGN